MALLVIHGAQLKCSMGSAPGTLSVLPDDNTNCEDQYAATIQAYQPNTNISPFGLCRSLANPQVAAATAAANGTLTPQPCEPVTTSPWTPGSNSVKIGKQAALTPDSKCNCQYGGVIEITSPKSQKTGVA
ncbi:MAG: DUF4280 domain-containing protein [Deltaproteobacteria bacterium]|nr:DUF4280 domain-containing protein [Deltaproteobacteria bacterium]